MRLTSGAAFPSRALGCLLSHKLKPEHSLVCLCVCVCYAIQACPAHPSSPPPAPLHNLPGSVFTLTAALTLQGSVTMGQLHTEIRTGFISPLNTFLLEVNQRTKAETGRTVRLNLTELIVSQLMSGS